MKELKTPAVNGKFGLQYTITQANQIIIHNTHNVGEPDVLIPIEDVLMLADRIRKP